MEYGTLFVINTLGVMFLCSQSNTSACENVGDNENEKFLQGTLFLITNSASSAINGIQTFKLLFSSIEFKCCMLVIRDAL